MVRCWSLANGSGGGQHINSISASSLNPAEAATCRQMLLLRLTPESPTCRRAVWAARRSGHGPVSAAGVHPARSIAGCIRRGAPVVCYHWRPVGLLPRARDAASNRQVNHFCQQVEPVLSCKFGTIKCSPHLKSDAGENVD